MGKAECFWEKKSEQVTASSESQQNENKIGRLFSRQLRRIEAALFRGIDFVERVYKMARTPRVEEFAARKPLIHAILSSGLNPNRLTRERRELLVDHSFEFLLGTCTAYRNSIDKEIRSALRT